MHPRPDLQQLTRQALRSYVLAHRDDQEALRLYMDRLKTDPDVIRYTGGYDIASELQRLIAQHSVGNI